MGRAALVAPGRRAVARARRARRAKYARRVERSGRAQAGSADFGPVCGLVARRPAKRQRRPSRAPSGGAARINAAAPLSPPLARAARA